MWLGAERNDEIVWLCVGSTVIHIEQKSILIILLHSFQIILFLHLKQQTQLHPTGSNNYSYINRKRIQIWAFIYSSCRPVIKH